MSCCSSKQERMLLDVEPVIRWVLRRYRLHGDEDMLQEVRLALITAILEYDPGRGSSWTTFAGLVARNTVLNERQRGRAFKRGWTWVEVPIDVVAETEPAPPPPDRYPIELHLFVLTDEEREALDGRMRGEAAHETAVRLGISTPTVQARQRKAVARLRSAHGVCSARAAFADIVTEARAAIDTHVALERVERKKHVRLDRDRIRELYLQGYSSGDIARACDTTPSSVIVALRSLGVPRRKPGHVSPQRAALTGSAA